MASAGDLDERFQAAVKGIQRLPSSGSLQPSNLTKLIFYGLFKQATVGPCNEPRPSVFNVINRAKWDAWDRYRSLSKEEAMLAYIDEIRKVIQTMPISDEVAAFSKMIEPPSNADQQHSALGSTPHHPSTVASSSVDHQSRSQNREETALSTANAVVPFSSATSSSSSSMTSSDLDEFFHDLPEGPSPDQYEMIDNTHSQDIHQHAFGDQTERTNSTRQVPTRERNYSNTSSRYSSSFRHPNLSIASNANHERDSRSAYNRDTQRAILSALTKLQNDVHNILERLNRLETSAALLQQRELILSSASKSSLRWFPLSGLHRKATAFILIWPFFAFALIRLFLHAKIIIRFRQRRLL